MPTLLYINDNNLLIQQGTELHRSQGYAWLDGVEVVFDSDAQNSALRNCRRSPQQINSRYWQQCEQTAIASNGAGMRHAADLVWRHLSELKRQYALQDVVLVVPSHYRASNLELLLGIAKSCGLSVVGMVNKSVLALRDQVSGDGDYLHIDIQLHQAVATAVSVQQGRVKLGSAEIIQSVGIQPMQDALLKSLQHSFIQSDRFDPLHYASTEQQMFDQLPNLALELATHGKGNVNVEREQRVHSTSVDSKQWSQVLEPLFKTLVDNAAAARADAVFVDANAAFSVDHRMNKHASLGFAGLQSAGMVMLATASDVDSQSLVSTAPETGAVDYVNDLPIAGSDNPAALVSGQQVTSKVAPDSAADKFNSGKVSHLLQAGVAIPIARAELSTLGGQLSVRQASTSNLQTMLSKQTVFILNDAERRQLQPNDRVGSNMADGVITAISVID